MGAGAEGWESEEWKVALVAVEVCGGEVGVEADEAGVASGVEAGVRSVLKRNAVFLRTLISESNPTIYQYITSDVDTEEGTKEGWRGRAMNKLTFERSPQDLPSPDLLELIYGFGIVFEQA